MRDEKQDNAESGLFFANGGMPVPVYEGQEFPFIIKSKCITLWLEIIDRDAKDDYNANYKLHKIIDEIELNMKARTIKQIAHSEAILVEGDIRTIPDHPGNGARTLNGTYTWENVEHQFRGGFECVQVRIPPEEPGRPTNGVLRTATMNVNGNYCGKYRHDGINIHPPNPNSKRHVWKNPWCKLSSTEIQASPYSMGCWQPRPDQRNESWDQNKQIKNHTQYNCKYFRNNS